MPNWCTTSYAVTGPTSQVNALWRRMRKLQEMKEPLVPNGFGPSWLGCLVKSLGKNPNRFDCRGDWSSLKLEKKQKKGFLNCEGPLLTFDTETAWYRCSEVEQLIQNRYPDLNIFFISEELGCGYFETNDEDGEFFPEQVIIDDALGGMGYYSKEDAIAYLNERAEGVMEVKTWKDAEKFCAMRNELQENAGGEAYIYLHVAEIAE